MSKYIVTFVALSLLSFSAASKEICMSDYSTMGAHYQVSTVVSKTKSDIKYRARRGAKAYKVDDGLVFWRRNSEVAYQYPNKHITEIWNQQANGRIRPVRYFDEHRRGIEYQASEVYGGQKSKSGEGLVSRKNEWSEKFQLISNAFRHSMVLEKTSGSGCDKLAYYIKKDNDKTYRMVWSPSLGLPVDYKEMSAYRTYRIKLTDKVTDLKAIDAFFALRDTYQTTDYADIGDNESDPFLLGMINLGFVEHGSSGFYNVDGGDMGSRSAHNH